MSFNELIRLLETNGFRLVKHKGSVRYYGKPGIDRLVRVDFHGAGGPEGHLPSHPQGRRHQHEVKGAAMLDLAYSLVIEATEDPNFFGFYSPDLEGFTGVGHSIEDACTRLGGG